MSFDYTTDNISNIRANATSLTYSSAVINEHTTQSYANLLSPYVIDNAGYSDIVSLTIDVRSDDGGKEIVNEKYLCNKRGNNDLTQANDYWFFKEAYHKDKTSRAISNAFVFGGQKLRFYIAPKGHRTGYVDNQWLYAHTMVTVKVFNPITADETLLYSFNGFELLESDSSRYFDYTVPEENDASYNNYGIYGLNVLKIEVSNTYYVDAERNMPYDGEVPSDGESYLQLLIYSASRELREVNASTADILKTTIDQGASWETIFENSVFSDYQDSILPLDDDQKRAIIADQVATLFISQHPVLTADNYPSKILGFGVEEAEVVNKEVQKIITYGLRYPEVAGIVKDRLFGLNLSYLGYNFAKDIANIIQDHTQSSQKVLDPVRIISMDSKNVINDLIGEDGLSFDPFGMKILNSTVSKGSEVELEMALISNQVNISEIEVTDKDGNPLAPYNFKIKVSFDVISGEENIDRILFVVASEGSRNYEYYLDSTGMLREYTFTLERPIVPEPVLNGADLTAQIIIEDGNGIVYSFLKKEFVDPYGSKPIIHDLQVAQRNNGTDVVDISYTYDGIGSVNNGYAILEYSNSAGTSWTNATSTSLLGDFGYNIIPGRKTIAWDMSEDLASIPENEDVICRLTFVDTDNSDPRGGNITSALVWDLTDPEVAIKKLVFDEYEDELDSSSSSVSSSSDSSSSSLGYSSSSSSSSLGYSSSSSSSSIDSSSSSSSLQYSSSSSSSSISSESSSSSSSLDSSSSSSSSLSSDSSTSVSSESSSSSIDSSSSSSSSSLEGWVVRLVDSLVRAIYPNNCIAFDSNGEAGIAYYVFGDSDLRYAKWDGAAWNIEIVDSNGDVGRYPSLDFDSNDYPHISYYDRTNEDLKVASWNGSAWNLTTVDSTGYVGRFTSLKVDSSDDIHVSYYERSVANLKYANYNGSSWSIETVDSFGWVGMYTSLYLDSSDNPGIAYQEGSSKNLKYAKYNGATWAIETVEATDNAGQYASLVLDSSDRPRIAHYNGNSLRFASWNGASWDRSTIDSQGYHCSAGIDGSNNIYVSYINGGQLWIAEGPSTWDIELVDPSLSCVYSSIAVNSVGKKEIAFTRNVGNLAHAFRGDV